MNFVAQCLKQIREKTTKQDNRFQLPNDFNQIFKNSIFRGKTLRLL